MVRWAGRTAPIAVVITSSPGGAVLHPMGAYLVHRGLTTLPTRVRAQQANAREVAAWLLEHPAVSRVYYPGYGGDPRGVLGNQLRGTGAMVSIGLRGGYDAAARLTSRVRLFTHAVSLGGVDSLVQHPAALTHRPVAPDARPGGEIVRLSIGLENAADLIADLDLALDRSGPPSAEPGQPADVGRAHAHA